MSRLGVLYALTDKELAELCARPEAERYDYMLEEFEERLFGTPRSCALDKAWYGIQLCLGGGKWRETNRTPLNILVGGEFLVDTENEIITLKDHIWVKDIAYWLCHFSLAEQVRQNFPKITDTADLPPYVTDLDYLLESCAGITPFYDNADKEHLQVIFTVDL